MTTAGPNAAPTDLPAGTVGALVSWAAVRYDDRTAYIDAGREYTYADMEAAADRLACGLLELGLARGDRIGLIGLNQIEWLQVFFAAARIGVVVVAMTVRYRDNELQYMANDSCVKAIFTVAEHEGFDFLALFRRLGPDTPTIRHLVCIDRPESLPQELPEGVHRFSRLSNLPPRNAMLAELRAAVQPGDLVMIIYTSGTTGRPKGAGLTHRSLLASARAQHAHTRVDTDDLTQLGSPLNHVGGITCGVMTFMLGGGTIELVPEFKASGVLDMMRQRPPTLIGGVPTMLTLLLMNARSEGVDFGRVRLVTIGGSNVESALMEQVRQRMPRATIMNLYGLSEASGALVMSPWDASGHELLETIGKPLPGVEVQVRSFDGGIAATGEIGELCFRAPGVIDDYVGQARGNDAFDGGWLHTGDLGYLDAGGFITLKGRRKDMYIQGGFNVYPAEIENVIARHPKVAMVAGIGVPDAMFGEVGRYYIVPRPDSELTEDDIREYCREHIADYKIPRQIVLRDALPLTPAGKIHKAALRQETL